MALIAITVLAATALGVFAEQRYSGQAKRLSHQILTFMLWVLVPFVAFINVAHLQLTANAGTGIAFAYLSLIIVALCAWQLSTRVFHLPRKTTGAVIVTAMLVNTGYLGLPMVAAILGTGQIGEGAVYDTLVSAPMFLIGAFAVGAVFGDVGKSRKDQLKTFLFKNPPLVAVVVALFVPSSLINEGLLEASHVATFLLAPLGFFAVGVALQSEAEGGIFRFPPPLTAPVAVAVGLRLIAGPALLFAISAPFITLPDTYLLLSAMPCGINSVIVAHACKLDLRVTASAVAWSTALVIFFASILVNFG